MMYGYYSMISIKRIKSLNSTMNNDFLPLRLLIIQGTPLCNIDCSYCYLPDRNNTAKISLATIEKLFENIFSSQIASNGFTTVWHAGEPLVLPIKFYQNVFEIIRNLNAGNFDITHSFQTNGTLINQEWCDFFHDNTNTKVSISLDGPEFLHDKFRVSKNGKGTHKYTMKGIELLHKNNIPFNVIAVITKDTLDHPDEFFHFFERNDVNRLALNYEEIEGINKTSSLEGDEVKSKFIDFMKRIYHLSQTSSMAIREFRFLENALFKGHDTSKNQLVRPFAMLNVDINGNFSTFSPELLTVKDDRYGDFILGNVHDDLIINSLKSPKFIKIQEEIKAGVDICKNNCYYFSLCGGGSPSNKLAENKSFNSGSSLSCELRTKVLADIMLEYFEERVRE